MSDVYPIGQPIRLSTAVADSAGAAADPTALTLVVTAPDGTATTKRWPTPAEITRDSAGAFHYDVTASAAGHYLYTWTAAGSNAGVDSDVLDVFDPATYPRLVSFADAKSFLRLTGTADDALLDRMIGWASARILREIQATLTSVTDRVTVDGFVFTVPTVPVQAVTAIAAIGNATLPAEVGALSVRSPLGGVIQSYPSWLCGVYDVTYTAGYSTVPAGADGACLTLLRHWWNQSQAHGSATYGDTGFVPDFKGLPNAALNMLASAPQPPPLIA